MAPQAGLAHVTRDGATAFHCERRWRVLLRDIFRFGTATVFSSSCSVVLLGVLLERCQARPPRVDRRFVCVVRVVRQACATFDA